MTTKEFIKEIEELGYENIKFGGNLVIWDGDNILVEIEHTRKGLSLSEHFYKLDDFAQMELFTLADAYAKTPIADRVEEEKFYWRVKGWQNLSYNEYYLSTSENLHEINWVLMYQPYAKPYTQKEYDKMVADGLIADIFEKEAIES